MTDADGPDEMAEAVLPDVSQAMTSQRPETVSKLPLMIMGAVVAMAALLLVVLFAVRGPETYEPGSPEAALQTFVETAFDRDGDALLALLTPDLQARCADALDRSPSIRFWYGDDLRAELSDIEVTGDTARAEVRFRQSSADDPFDTATWSFEHDFDLVRVDGVWLLDAAGWPSPLDVCSRSGQ